jgi:hypothetical protein
LTAQEPLLFRPRIFYSIAGTGLLAGLLGLTPWATYPNPVWWLGALLSTVCLSATLVCWAIPVPVAKERTA